MDFFTLGDETLTALDYCCITLTAVENTNVCLGYKCFSVLKSPGVTGREDRIPSPLDRSMWHITSKS